MLEVALLAGRLDIRPNYLQPSPNPLQPSPTFSNLLQLDSADSDLAIPNSNCKPTEQLLTATISTMIPVPVGNYDAQGKWQEPAEYAALDAAFKKQYSDVFSDKGLPAKLPPDNGFRHHIRFKNENTTINGRNMRIPQKYHKHIKDFIDKLLKAGRI